MRCSACFADVDSPSNALCCVVCKLFFHIRCTSWKNLEDHVVMCLKNNWHCIFCRKNQIKQVLFLVDGPSFGIKQQTYVKRNTSLSTKNFERKLMDFQKTNFNSTFILDDMLKSLSQLRTSVGSLSELNNKSACNNVKLKRMVGDMTYKLNRLYFV